jgi:hypothetical protein
MYIHYIHLSGSAKDAYPEAKQKMDEQGRTRTDNLWRVRRHSVTENQRAAIAPLIPKLWSVKEAVSINM